MLTTWPMCIITVLACPHLTYMKVWLDGHQVGLGQNMGVGHGVDIGQGIGIG